MTTDGPKFDVRVPTVSASAQSRTRAAANGMREVQATVSARLDKYLWDSGRSLEFRIDSSTHATVITVRRADTGEVVRQLPTEEALRLLRRLTEESGTLLDLFA